MAKFIGAYLAFLYNLRQHLWADIPLYSWLIALFIIVAPMPVLGILPGGLALAVLCVVVALVIIISSWWAKRNFYIHFVADTGNQVPGEHPPLWPEDKQFLYATGHFFVEGKEGKFTNLLAYYRTFETREHAIMARITPSRYLKVGNLPPDLLGMWYIFVSPEALTDVVSGQLYHGADPKPALKLSFTRTNEKGKPVATVAYLSFDNESDCSRVFADLLLDKGGPARIPWRM